MWCFLENSNSDLLDVGNGHFDKMQLPTFSSGGSSNGWLRTLTTSSTLWAQQIRFMWQSPTTSVLQMILDNWSQPGDFESWFSVPVLFGEQLEDQTSQMVSSLRNSSCFLKSGLSKRKSSRVSLSCIPPHQRRSQLPCVSNLLLLRHHRVMASPLKYSNQNQWQLPTERQIHRSAKKLVVKLVLHLAKTIIGLFREVIRYHRTLLLHNPSNEPLPHDLQRRHFDWPCRKSCTMQLKTTTAFFSNPQRLPVFLERFLWCHNAGQHCLRPWPTAPGSFSDGPVRLCHVWQGGTWEGQEVAWSSYSQ